MSSSQHKYSKVSYQDQRQFMKGHGTLNVDGKITKSGYISHQGKGTCSSTPMFVIVNSGHLSRYNEDSLQIRSNTRAFQYSSGSHDRWAHNQYHTPIHFAHASYLARHRNASPRGF